MSLRLRHALVLATVVVACTSYGTAPALGPVVDDDAGSSAGVDASPDVVIADVAVDVAKDTGPTCGTRKPDGESCQDPIECCSKSCVFGYVCGGACKGLAVECTEHAQCCKGLWCAVGARRTCSECIPRGQPAATLVGGFVPIPESCCSLNVNFGTCT